MAEQVNQAEQVAQPLSEEDKKLNRQINYFIMRYMWQVVRGRKRNDDDTIYAAFETSRERYTRVINTGTIRYGKGELDGLQQRTGLRKEIFTGEVRFECPYSVKAKDSGIEKSITTEEWNALFQWRKNRKESSAEEGEEKAKTCQDEIYGKLKKVRRNDMSNWDFYRLCFYLQNMKAAPLRASPGKLREIETAIKDLSFTLLDGCEVAQLQKFQKLLKDKQTLITAMVTYKNAREKERSK